MSFVSSSNDLSWGLIGLVKLHSNMRSSSHHRKEDCTLPLGVSDIVCLAVQLEPIGHIHQRCPHLGETPITLIVLTALQMFNLLWIGLPFQQHVLV